MKAVAEVLERWFNGKPTGMAEDAPPKSPEHLPVDHTWCEPVHKKSRYNLASDPASDAPDDHDASQISSSVRKLVTSAIEAVVVEASTCSRRATPAEFQACPEWPQPTEPGSVHCRTEAAVTGANLLELFADCLEIEEHQTWIPQHANCKECGGFCFAPTSDVARQLGVCGCVVATEMELEMAEDRQARAEALGRKMAWTFKEICAGTAVPIRDWPAIAEVLIAASKPDHDLLKPEIDPYFPGKKLGRPAPAKRQRSPFAPKRQAHSREAPRATFYHRLGQRKM